MQLEEAGSSDAAIAVGHLNARPEIAHPPCIRPHPCTRPTQGSLLAQHRRPAGVLLLPHISSQTQVFDTPRRSPTAAKHLPRHRRLAQALRCLFFSFLSLSHANAQRQTQIKSTPPTPFSTATTQSYLQSAGGSAAGDGPEGSGGASDRADDRTPPEPSVASHVSAAEIFVPHKFHRIFNNLWGHSRRRSAFLWRH